MVRGTWLARSVLALGVLASAPNALAETVLRAGGGSATWTAAESPYRLVAPVAFEDLTVEPGTIVRYSYDAFPAIAVSGAFVVNGTPGAPVVFEKEGGGGPDEASGGIRAGTFDVRCAIFRHASFALMGGSSSEQNRITESTFEENNWAIEVQGNLSVDRVAFVGNNTAIFGGASASPFEVRVTNSKVTGGNGFVFLDTSTTTVDVSSSTFVGVYAPVASAAAASIRNSIIVDSTFNLTTPRIEVFHSLLWQVVNASSSITEGAGILRDDPAFVSSTDFHLSAASPAIDSGSPNGAPDHDFDGAARPVGLGGS